MKFKIKKEIFFFLLIFALGMFLRFYKLGQIPAGINRDEASIGYNAYSILKTAKEEHGRLLPLFIESFGDWKLPAYQYLSIPFIALFGLSAFSVRFLSALAGSLSIVVIFALAKTIFLTKDSKAGQKQNPNLVGLLSALFLAINPWSLHISRIAFEANLACFFFLLGLLFFVKFNKGFKFFILGSVFWVLSLFSYHAAYVFLPLMFGLLFLKAFRENVSKKSIYLGAVIFFAALLLHFVQFMSQAEVKITGVGITSDPVIRHLKTELVRFEHQSPVSLGARIWHSRFVVFPWLIAEKYLATFSSGFLFFQGGDNFHHNISGFGNFYAVNLIFFLAGIFILLQKNHKYKLLLLTWLVLAPLPSAITKNSPHTLRSIFLLPVYLLYAGLGASALFTLKNKLLRYSVLIVWAVGLFLNIGLYFDAYYIHAPLKDARHWNYGMQEIVNYLQSQQGSYEKIITSKPDYSSYIFYAFYTQYEPDRFWQEVEYYPVDNEGFRHVKKLGNLYFEEEIDYESGNLYFDYADDVPEKAIKLKTVYLPTGEPYLVVFTYEE